MSDDRFADRDDKKAAPAPAPKRIFATRAKPSQWVSTRAPGTPAQFEAMFDLIHASRTESAAFKGARRHRSDVTDDELWAAYHEWLRGRVHPAILRQKKTAEDLAREERERERRAAEDLFAAPKGGT